ncbi:MAG: hypothetical protein ACFHVJ_02040 [Aestuariibacter sp.]
MNTPGNFSVVVQDQLIRVDLQGQWTVADDREYLIELMNAFHMAKNAPWGMLVDMRGWQIDDALKEFKHEHVFHLDRRNQKAECWIVDDDNQGDHLAHYLESAEIPLQRCHDVNTAQQWLTLYGFKL